MVREGIMVDATIINAPSSTKNKVKERDSEMHQTRKRNQSGAGSFIWQAAPHRRRACRLRFPLA